MPSCLLSRRRTLAPLLTLALSLSACSGAGQVKGSGEEVTAERAPAATPQIQATPALARAGDASIADITARVLPSVVSISSTRTRRVQTPYHFFFGGAPQEQKQQGLGSGVILDSKGIVVTNNHVVEESDEIVVTTNDRRRFEAKVLGTDPKSDLAVLQLQGEVSGLTPVSVGSSADLRLGDVVLAIGNPFGVGQTVTMGIVSAKGRANMGIVDYEDFIQTDAAINPGNSGGALINMRGELVGINTAILSRSGGNVGIGFAIPTDMAAPIVHSLRTDGKVSRGWLGVAIQDLDADIQAALKLPSTAGVLLADVQDGTPAAKAGLERGDVVTQINGKTVDSAARFRNLIAAAGEGTNVKLGLIRHDKKLQLDVRLGENPSEARKEGAGQQQGLAGLRVVPLDEGARRKLGMGEEPRHGVVVAEVEAGSSAAQAGLQAGDVVLEVNRRSVKSPQELEAAYQKSGSRALLLVFRGGATLFVVLKG